MDRSTRSRLINAARTAAKRAYAPYSGFRVGAAVLTARGRLYTGANVENASYGLTVCAERIAVFRAVTARDLKITAIAVFTDTPLPTPPCGACLQVISEFATNPPLILAGREKTVTFHLKQLLPQNFKLRQVVRKSAPPRAYTGAAPRG